MKETPKKRRRVETRRWSDRVKDPKSAAKAAEGDRLRPRIPHVALVALLERAKREKRLDEAAKLLASMFPT
jgi:hypothetical protein